MGSVAPSDGHTNGRNGRPHAATPAPNGPHAAGDRQVEGDRDTRDVVRDMVREERAHATDGERPAGHRPATPSGRSSSPRASEPDVPSRDLDELARAIRDLKHDVRMVKVGLDKQGQMLESLVTRLERLVSQTSEPRGDRQS